MYGSAPKTSCSTGNRGCPPSQGGNFYRNQMRYDNSNRVPDSPIRIYDDDECLVRNPTKIVPFSRETVKDRIAHLEASAGIPLPKATDILKLLKSHNVALDDNDDIMVWYNRFHDFTMMLGMGTQDCNIQASQTILESMQRLQVNKKAPTKKSEVQCWLCDGPHTF